MWKNTFIPFSFRLYNNDSVGDSVGDPISDFNSNDKSSDKSDQSSDSFVTRENDQNDQLKDISDVLQPSSGDKEKVDLSKESKKIKFLSLKDKLFALKLNEQIRLIALGLGISVVAVWLIILLYRMFGSRKFY